LKSFNSSALPCNSILALFRSREEQAVVEPALRQRLAADTLKRPRPNLSPLDRAFWLARSRIWPSWKDRLVVVRPETVIRWHRDGFRRYWRSISTPGPGRPPTSKETKFPIIRLAMHRSVAPLNLGPLPVRDLSVCRESLAFTTDIPGAKPLDQRLPRL